MAPVNILVAVHGFEPAGWTLEVPRVIAALGEARLRVLRRRPHLFGPVAPAGNHP